MKYVKMNGRWVSVGGWKALGRLKPKKDRRRMPKRKTVLVRGLDSFGRLSIDEEMDLFIALPYT